MKPLIHAAIATSLLLGVVYGAAATGALTDRPLAVLGVLLIGVGMVKHHRDCPTTAAEPVRRPGR